MLAAALLVPLLAVNAYASKVDLVTVAADQQRKDPTLVLSMGKADVVELPGPISDIMIANPMIADVTVISPTKLYVAGLDLGDTNIIALDSEGEVVGRLNVHVKIDEVYLRELVKEFFPDEDVKIKALQDQIVLSGTVSSPAAASKITNLVMHAVTEIQDVEGAPDEYIASFLDVRGEQQVMLRVKIVEASRTVLRELGIETNANDLVDPANVFENLFDRPPPNNLAIQDASAGSGLTNLVSMTGLTQDPLTLARVFTDTGVMGLGILEFAFQALEQDGLINVLAEPNLTTVSGEQAGFLAGGEFPFPVGRDQVGNLIIEFRQFGVSLNFVPKVLSEDRISLQLNTEVSSLDFESGIELADTVAPGLDVRRAETTVEMPSGGSLMIAGLLKSEALDTMTGIPGIHDTPVLGDLISSESFQREETELLVIVTPYLVEPFAEKDVAEELPKHITNPLAKAFEANMRRLFGDLADDEVFEGDLRYGYLLE